eukprot:16150786-Heterocapsa_arctica.AAC.1
MELLEPAKQQLATWPRLDQDMVNKAIANTGLKTGLGFDKLSPRLLRELPPEGKRALLLLLTGMESELMLPAQSLFNAV